MLPVLKLNMASKYRSSVQAIASALVLSLFCVAILPAVSAQPRIVGGEEVQPNEVIYQASIRVYDQHICGGTIIGPNHVLTAAHCFFGLGLEKDIVVVTGSTKLQDNKNVYPISKITYHKDFTNSKFDSFIHDIAVITLRDQIIFDTTQGLARLPSSPISKGLIGTAVGWGLLRFGYTQPAAMLQKVEVNILTWEECQTMEPFKIYPSQICGFAGKDKGTCQGDSGGPLLVDGTVVGIASCNIPCATGVPDVFTNVYYYLDFIYNVMYFS